MVTSIARPHGLSRNHVETGTDSGSHDVFDHASSDSSPSSSLSGGRSQSGKETVPTGTTALQPFNVDTGDNGFSNRPRTRRKRWWNGWSVRKQVNKGDATYSDPTKATKRRGLCLHYLVFGGSSGLAFLVILLAINLTLVLATHFYTKDMADHTLDAWGKRGTGTEQLAWYPTDFTRDVVPIPCHSHNDYWRRVPLFSAIRAGLTSVESDVWLVDDDLLVGHDEASLQRNRTFRSLYIDPLVQILERQNPKTEFYTGDNKNGVFDMEPHQGLVLLVDLKTGGKETWPVVMRQVEPLRERGWLTYVKDGVIYPGPVTIVGSGNTPFDLLTENATTRDAFFDAPLERLGEAESAAVADPIEAKEESALTDEAKFTKLNSYYASVSFNKVIGEIQKGEFSARQLELIRGHIRGAHARGLKVRYWSLPSWPIGLRDHVWDVLVKEGVDTLSVDDIQAVSEGKWCRNDGPASKLAISARNVAVNTVNIFKRCFG